MNATSTAQAVLADGIPVIDIAGLQRERTLRALDEACREWGFFQVVGHGIDTRVLTDLERAARAFFALPMPDKQAIARSAENPWGFYDRELTKNTRDWKQIFDYGPGDGGHLLAQWPAAQPAFRTAVLAYYAACEQLAFRLLGAISHNLGMAPDHLAQGFRPRHSSFLRLNYYPLCPAPARPDGLATPKTGHLGINHHTDAGALTILAQDRQPGLEVYRDGQWYLVPPRDDALVINIGDIVQVWSNDRYRAALHRVLANARAERISAPFFFNPAYTTHYAPLASLLDAANRPRYRPICWGEFRARRAAGDYADDGEEVQISHYRVARCEPDGRLPR